MNLLNTGYNLIVHFCVTAIFHVPFLELFTSVPYFSFYGTCFSFLEFLTKSIPGHLFLTFYNAVNSFLISSLLTRGHIQTRKWIKTGKNNYKCQILSYGRQNVNNKCIKKQPCVRIRVCTRLKRLCESLSVVVEVIIKTR